MSDLTPRDRILIETLTTAAGRGAGLAQAVQELIEVRKMTGAESQRMLKFLVRGADLMVALHDVPEETL